MILSAKISALACVPISNTSLRPLLVSRSVGSPLCSKRALVATVVPILTVSILSTGIGSDGFRPKDCLMPSMAASS